MKPTVNITAKILAITLLVLSCDSNKVYESFVPIPGHVWSSSHILAFDVGITDTVSTCDLYIYVRNVSRYEYSNLYLFVSAHSPDGNAVKDTIEIMLADDNGKWYGKGAASIFTLEYPYKTHVRFPVAGIYTFEIEQAMRVQELRHISDIGLRIERAGTIRQ